MSADPRTPKPCGVVFGNTDDGTTGRCGVLGYGHDGPHVATPDRADPERHEHIDGWCEPCWYEGVKHAADPVLREAADAVIAHWAGEHINSERTCSMQDDIDNLATLVGRPRAWPVALTTPDRADPELERDEQRYLEGFRDGRATLSRADPPMATDAIEDWVPLDPADRAPDRADPYYTGRTTQDWHREPEPDRADLLDADRHLPDCDAPGPDEPCTCVSRAEALANPTARWERGATEAGL